MMADELSSGGKHATDLIGLINWQLKRIENVKHLSREGVARNDIMLKLKMTPYVFDIVRRQAQRFTTGELASSFKLLLESDMAIKQGLKDPGLALETLIVNLCAKS